MKEYSCPSCGASVKFISKASIFAVCPYCRSMLVRHDVDVETIGTMAETMDEDTTPLQLGTEGVYQDKRFGLAGRVRLAWSDGSWDEWYAWFNDGSQGWVAQAQGFYMVSFQIPDLEAPDLAGLRVGERIEFEEHSYQVDDIKKTTCVASEGELPFKAPKGRTGTSVDLSGPARRFACIEYSEEGTRVFEGHYVDFDDLKLSFMRPLDGW